MRNTSEKTGRSYRVISSRCAASRPSRARATTSASGRFARSRARSIWGGGDRVVRVRAIVASAEKYPRLAPQSRRMLAQLPARGELMMMHDTDVESARAELAAEGGGEKRAYVRKEYEERETRDDVLQNQLSRNIDV